MSFRRRMTALMTLGLFAGLTVVASAQEQRQGKPEGERQRTEATTLTGCLAKGDTANQYVLTESSGTKTTV
ncbi:MAG TPA: hypothetical protein VFL57_14835, partial [Bryobacteraceae bacterium]|nr:hypothetical protein [Bryobacteraceae bacterium]